MHWQHLALIAAAFGPLAAMLSSPSHADETMRITGPAVHENLAVYFIHGKSAGGPVPLSLNEAMAAGKVVVHETGNVNMLSIENLGAEEVFVQAGDIVKGGQQDRVLTISMLVPSRSGRLDIAAYCVEQGRWSARGKEDVKRFASAEKALPSRDAKLAMLLPSKPRPSADAETGTRGSSGDALPRTRPADPSLMTQQRVGRSDTSSRQSEVWSTVANAQRKLTENLGAPVAAAASASSLQLSLENERLVTARKSYLDALDKAARDDDIVGYVFAIGGKLNSGDVYASNALFQKMWKKQLEAAITEAIAEGNAAVATPPTADDVRAFIARSEAGKAEQTKLLGDALVRETRDSDVSLVAETRRASGSMVHKAYVAR